ncbi:MAG: RluA family pseudouridine synthase, partial [Planctomycetota bacterium]
MGRAEPTHPDLSRPIREFAFVVGASEEGLRLDRLLRRHFPWRSRSHYQRLLACGDVQLGARAAKPSTRVRPGQRVVVALPVDPDAPERETADDLVILYEDDDLVAVDKPSGMTVHPVGRIRHGTLINKLHARYRRDAASEDVVPRLGHRLDKDTSGVLLVVKNHRTDQRMTDAFTERRVHKTYLALVRGVPRYPSGIVDAPIGRDPHGPTRLHMRVDATGQTARSRWTVREAWPHHALLELRPFTGRTHQLRVHAAHL